MAETVVHAGSLMFGCSNLLDHFSHCAQSRGCEEKFNVCMLRPCKGKESGLAVLGRSAGSVALCHSVRNHLVPLVHRLASEESHNDHCHVVTANTTSLAAGSETVVHHVLADRLQILLGSNTTTSEFNDCLGGLAIPDTCRLSALS